MADAKNSTGDEYMGQNQPKTEDTETTEQQEDPDAPVENKWNDLTPYWDYEDEGKRMSSDIPDVRIYISREKIPEDTETAEIDLDKAVAMNLVDSQKDMNSANTTIVGNKLAMNAINKLNEANLWK